MIIQLLTAPLSAPFSGFGFILRTLQNIAEKEINDPDRIRQDLLELQLSLEEGKITEKEYQEQEADIMVRLRAARAYQEELAGSQGLGSSETTIEYGETTVEVGYDEGDSE